MTTEVTPKPDTFDPAPALTYGSLFGVIVLTLFICVMIGIQVAQGKPISTEFVSALTFMMGWLTSEAGGIFSNRFGSTAQSAAKDTTIAQQARTAAVAQNALLDPAVSVTVDPAKRAAIPQINPLVPDPAPAQPEVPAVQPEKKGVAIP